MKKIMTVVAAVLMVAMAAYGASKTKSGAKGGKKSKAGSRTYEMINYQGATFGKNVPKWVEMIVEGQYDAKYLSKVMPGLEGKKAFVVQGRGNNLDFIKSWVNLYDIETEVGGMLERQTGKVVREKMSGKQSEVGNTAAPANVEKEISDYRMALQNVRIVGLEKVADYWIEVEVKEKKKVVDSYFEYYSVWAIDKKLLSAQLAKALQKEEDAELKQAVMDALTNELSVASNDKDIEEAADNYFIQENYYVDASQHYEYN